jgi:hypothetical protein
VRHLGAGHLLVFTILLAGCMPLHGYGSARVVRDGEFQHQVTLDLQANARSPSDTAIGRVLPVPMPRYGLRAGIGGGRELGGSVSWLGGSIDIKQQVVDADAIALAFAPGVAATALAEGGSIALARLPVLVEMQLASWLALRPGAALAYAVRLDRDLRGLLGTASMGIAITPTSTFTMEPAASVTIDPDSGFRYYGAGLGLQFGRAP